MLLRYEIVLYMRYNMFKFCNFVITCCTVARFKMLIKTVEHIRDRVVLNVLKQSPLVENLFSGLLNYYIPDFRSGRSTVFMISFQLPTKIQSSNFFLFTNIILGRSQLKEKLAVINMHKSLQKYRRVSNSVILANQIACYKFS